MDARRARPAVKPDRRGTVTVLVCAAALMFATGALAVADAGSFLLARSRAQAAADAAALAAIVEQVPALAHGEDPRAAAEAEAERNGATLVECRCVVGEASATVTVEIEPRVALLAGWAGRRVRATATAEVDPGLLTYRPDASGASDRNT